MPISAGLVSQVEVTVNMVKCVDCRKLRRFLLISLLLVAGCAKVGPNYARPPAEMNQNWLEAQDHRLETELVLMIALASKNAILRISLEEIRSEV